MKTPQVRGEGFFSLVWLLKTKGAVRWFSTKVPKCFGGPRSEVCCLLVPELGGGIPAVAAQLSLSVSMGVVTEQEILFEDQAHYGAEPRVTHGRSA